MSEVQKVDLGEFVTVCETVAKAGGGQKEIAEKTGLTVERVAQLRTQLTNPKGAYGFKLTPLKRGRAADISTVAAALAAAQGVEVADVMAARVVETATEKAETETVGEEGQD